MAYPPDPALERELFALLGSVWPRVPGAIERARRLGGDWAVLSTPFVSRDEGGRAVGHAGLLELRLVVEGRERALAGVHGVCVAPEARGRGHMRRALEQALACADARWAGALLWTSEPALYERFGFAPRPESAALLALAPRGARGAALGGRPVDLDDPRERDALRALLRERAPLSSRAAARDDGAHFLVDLALTPGGEGLLRRIDAPECVVLAERAGPRLVVHDLLARAVPPLEELAAALDPGAAELELRADVERWLARPHRRLPHPSEDVLMARGRALPEGLGPFCLSPFIRC